LGRLKLLEVRRLLRKDTVNGWKEKEEKGKTRIKLLLQGPATKVLCSSPAEKLIQGLEHLQVEGKPTATNVDEKGRQTQREGRKES